MFSDIISTLEKDPGNSKIVGKAYYNLAIVNENLRDFDGMFEAAKKAHEYLGTKKSKEYLKKAKYRRNSELKLDKQMEKATKENEQENR